MSTLIAILRRRDSKANWNSEDTILKDGQLGFEEGTAEFGAPRIKFGDGVTGWNSLPYINRKDNLTATVDPTTSDDDSLDYSVGSKWNNINDPDNPKFFILTDLSSGANWVQLNAGGAGSQTLAQTLVLGNTTGGEDVVFSAGDVADFTNAGVSQNVITFPNSVRILHVASGALGWYHRDISFANAATTNETFKINDDGVIDVGSTSVDGSVAIHDSSSSSTFTINTPDITTDRSETLPDADIDWSGATDGQVMVYDASTQTWSPEDQSGGGTSDHALLSNLSWLSSGHTGTANRFPAFGPGGTTIEVIPSGNGNRVLLGLSASLGTTDEIAKWDASGNIVDSGLTIDSSNNLSGVNNVTGVDTDFVTGTAGTSGNLSEWNADGDLVDAGVTVEDVKKQSFVVACSDETTDLTTGTAKVTFRMPYAFNVTGVRASVTTAPTGANLEVDINEGGVSILSTVISIDAGEKTSTTATTPPVISDSSLADDAEITIDIDQIGSSTAGAGLKVSIIGYPT